MQLHDSLFREPLQRADHALKPDAKGCIHYPLPLLPLGNYFFIPKGQYSGSSVLQTSTGG